MEAALHRYRFLDPVRCSGSNIARESDYLTAFIEKVEPESFVLLPYHEVLEIIKLNLKKLLNYP